MSQNLKTIILLNGKPTLMIDPSSYVNVEDKTLNINIPHDYVMSSRSLVGMGGLFIKPQFIGAKTCEDVIKSFKWFESQFPGYRHLSQTSSAVYLAISILSNKWSFSPLTLMALPSLSFSVRTIRKWSSKLSELKKYSRTIKALNPNKEVISKPNIPSILQRFHDFNSELAIARAFAKYSNVEFHTGKGPDFYADGVGIEVTRLRPDLASREKLQQKISDRANEKFKKGAEIVSMDLTHTTLGAQMWGFTDPRTLNIHQTIVEALKYAKKGHRVLLTYTYKPNTMNPLGMIHTMS